MQAFLLLVRVENDIIAASDNIGQMQKICFQKILFTNSTKLVII